MSETTNLKLFKQDNPTTNTNNFDIEKTLNENWDKLDENAGTTNKKLESLEKVDSTTNETITTIQEEQTTQNENIEKNAEGIAQNKKDVDEELTKIKKENSLLKSQIPTGTASGNNIHLEDSSNLDFEWKLRCRSRQETREGYNLLNVPSNFEITSSQNNRIVPISLKANTTYTIQADEIDTDNISTSPNFLFRLRYNNEDVDNIRVLLRAKKISFTTMGNVDTVWIYSGTNYNESATTNTTFKNLMIYEGTAEKSYEPYTGDTLSPNPDYPQEIQNVGDNINLLNKDTVDASNNLRGNALDTGRRLIANKDGNYTYGAFKLGGRELLGKTLGIHADIETTGGNPRISIFAGNSSSLTKSLLQVVLSDSGTGYMTIPSNLNSELDTISAVLYVTTDASVVAGTYVDYTNLKVQVGSGEVVYSAHNCGNLGVTISNKNLYKVEKVIDDSNVPKFIFLREGNLEFTTGGVPLIIAPTTIKEKTEYTYILKCKSNVTTENNINFTGIYEDGTSELLSANKKKDTNEFIVKFKTNKEKTLAYVTQQYTNSAGVTIITEGTMILEGDYLNLEELYEIHQEQEILFPLAEGQKLRSLPNGIKDYLAEDGIHKNVGIIILNGSGGTNENYFKATDNKFSLGVNTEKGLLLKNLKTDNLKISVLSDKFLGVSWNIMNDTIEGWQIALRQDGSYTYLRLLTTGIEDTKALETFLQNNNAIVEYPLAKEEIIPYTQEQQAVIDKILYTYKNVTNISVDDELATLDITYKKDIETMFNNQAKYYNERLTNIENLLNTTETSALLLDNLENDLKEEV
jgi:hypothetical protein